MDYFNCPPPGFPSTSQNLPIPPYFPANIPPKPPRINHYDPRLAMKTISQSNPPLRPNLSIDNRSDDELWIEAWLSKLGKITINLDNTITINQSTTEISIKVKPSKLSLHLAHRVLVRCKKVIKELKQAEKHLREHVATMTSEEWKENTIKIGCLKDELSALFTQFESPQIMTSLKKLAFNRRKKRIGQKKRKLKKQQALEEEVLERNAKHQEIDKWLLSMKDSIKKSKHEEVLKKDADCILSEVNKKKSDAKKNLALIKALVELRSLKEIKILQNGEDLNLEDKVAFINVTDRLKSIWENALQNYKKEENALRKTLEQSAKDNEVSEIMAKHKKLISEWEEVFFGPKNSLPPTSVPFVQADTNLERFVAIRRSWDTFLTSPNDKRGTKIPVGWLLPDENASEKWMKYLYD